MSALPPKADILIAHPMNSHLGGGTAISPRFIAMPLAEVRLSYLITSPARSCH